MNIVRSFYSPDQIDLEAYPTYLSLIRWLDTLPDMFVTIMAVVILSLMVLVSLLMVRKVWKYCRGVFNALHRHRANGLQALHDSSLHGTA